MRGSYKSALAGLFLIAVGAFSGVWFLWVIGLFALCDPNIFEDN